MLERTGGIMRDYGYVARRRWRSIRIGMRPPEPIAGERAPVLLIPGVFETWHYLEAVGERLAAEGHPVHYIERLGLNRHPIAATAALAQRHLDELDLHDVVIVGHSKGGLIGKHMMTVDDEHGRIARLIAVNTPFPGTPLARYAVSAWREFAPDRPVIRLLEASTEANAHIVSIFSSFDQYIPASSRLDGATNIELPIVGHFRVLEDPLLLDEVARWVAEPPR